MESLSYPLILCQDVPILQELVQTCKPLNIVTRSQGQKQKEEEQINEQVPKVESGVSAVPKLISEHMYETQNGAEDQSEQSDIFSELPFFAEVVPEVAIKARKSKRQRRIEKMAGTVKNTVELPVPGSKETVQEVFSDLQKQDVTLEGPFKQAAEVQPGQLIEEGYYLKGQVLYYKGSTDDKGKLVVPQQRREQVLRLGHSIPWAGHLGTQKRRDRIASRFFWPGMNRDVEEFCQSCSICQLAGDKKVPKLPL